MSELNVHARTCEIERMVQNIDSIRKDFVARLREAAIEAGLKEWGLGKRLADATGVTAKASSKWLNMESMPDRISMLKLADFLSVRVEWLEHGIEPKHSQYMTPEMTLEAIRRHAEPHGTVPSGTPIDPASGSGSFLAEALRTIQREDPDASHSAGYNGQKIKSGGNSRRSDRLQAVREAFLRDEDVVQDISNLILLQNGAIRGSLHPLHRRMIDHICREIDSREKPEDFLRPRRSEPPVIPPANDEGISEDEVHVYVQQLDAKAAAGHGEENTHVEVRGALAFKKSWIKRKGLKVNNLAAIFASGRSMEPTIHEWDALLVDKGSNSLKNDRVFAFLNKEGETIVKRAAKEGGAWLLRSDNPDKSVKAHQDMPFTDDEGQRFDVIGQVIWRGGDL